LNVDGEGSVYGWSRPKFIPTTENLKNAVVKRNLTFVERPTYLLKFKNATVEGDNVIRTDCSLYLGFLTGSGHIPTITKRKTFPFKNLFVVNSGRGNYYHWMVEGMSRAFMILDHIMTRAEFNQDSYILMPYTQPVKDLLDLVDFDWSKIAVPNDEYAFKASEVYVLDWPRDYNLANNQAIQRFLPSRESMLNLQKRLLTGAKAKYEHKFALDVNGRRKVVYSARRTNYVRWIRNELWFISRLRKELNDYHIDLVVHQGKEPMVDQLAMFYTADLVIGAHGGGLSNILFCRPHTPVIELPVKATEWNGYGFMSAALDLDYWIVPEVNTAASGFYDLDRTKIDIILETILHVLFEKDESE
jgi:hypothetical protein